ncbi:MAG: hypothetical protein H0W48_11330 [Methylibium sp.]|nr:hypothetical protein [Methylibium sp.]
MIINDRHRRNRLEAQLLREAHDLIAKLLAVASFENRLVAALQHRVLQVQWVPVCGIAHRSMRP